jgi:beta-ribofuranosylaminobenzene 5'-phosphate synthase
LHFGLIDLNGELGRINGGLGIALDKPEWVIEGSDREIKKTNGKFNNKINEIKNKFDLHFNAQSKNINFKILKQIPSHVGLGSNTQFHLAIAKILCEFHNLSPTITEVANIVRRGGTSGIGVAAFNKGGFILDGGHSFGPGKQTDSFQPSRTSQAPPPPIIFRNYPPKNWRFLLITPKDQKGAFGENETNLFYNNCPIPSEDVEKLSRLILMKILPALIEKNIKVFGEGLTDIHKKFTKFGMEQYQEGLSKELFNYLEKQENVFGYGISSFGPTIYALTDSLEKSQVILSNLATNFQKKKFELLFASSINTSGAKIKRS